MCTCASCKVTDAYAGLPDLFGKEPAKGKAGFAEWPKGEPVGPRASAAIYSQHVAHSRFDARQPDTRGFRLPGLVYPVTPAPKFVIDWINRNGPQFEPIPKPVVKSTPRLIALARELRRAA